MLLPVISLIDDVVSIGFEMAVMLQPKYELTALLAV
jgi:hypothetical protein